MTEPLQTLAEAITEASGIELAGERLGSLRTAIDRVAPGMTAAGVLRALQDPAGGAALRVALSEAVAVHETFFFRHRDDLEAIRWRDLLDNAHAAGTGRIRVWVAGCSTGEEAYTLMLLATRELASVDPPVEVLATDLSSAALARAERGEYGERSMRLVDDDLRALHFVRHGRVHHVRESLRRHVTFRAHNLVTEPPPPGPFDLILCRNVLIYFRPATVSRVLASLESALAPGGTLLLGAADRLCRPRSTTVGSAKPRPARPEPVPSTWRTRRPAPEPRASTADLLAKALGDADAGRLDDAIEQTDALLRVDPLDADAQFVRGIAELQRGNAGAAIDSFRRALYVDPGFALAAFKLGRAYDATDDHGAARRAYRQALQTLAPGHERQCRLAPDIDLADIAAACSARLTATEIQRSPEVSKGGAPRSSR